MAGFQNWSGRICPKTSQYQRVGHVTAYGANCIVAYLRDMCGYEIVRRET